LLAKNRMKFFNIFKKKRASPGISHRVESQQFLEILKGNRTLTKAQALSLPCVSGAIDFLSNIVATIPVKLYSKQKGKVIECLGSQRANLLNKDTGDTLDGFQLKKAMVRDYFLGSGGYAYIKRTRNSKAGSAHIAGLFFVPEEEIAINYSEYDPIFKNYEFLVQTRKFKSYEFLKLLRATRNGVTGVSVISEISKALAAAYYNLALEIRTAKAGGVRKGYLQILPGASGLSPAAEKQIQKAWATIYKRDIGEVSLIPKELEYKELSPSNAEMQLNESKKIFQDEINQIFHIKDNFQDTFKEAIFPILKAFEATINREMLLEEEKNRLYFEFDTKEILKASLKERFEAYKIAKETGFLTLNEIRKMENLEGIEGMDVLNLGLGSVLFNTTTHTYYTPNTSSVTKLDKKNGKPDSKEEAPELEKQNKK